MLQNNTQKAEDTQREGIFDTLMIPYLMTATVNRPPVLDIGFHWA